MGLPLTRQPETTRPRAKLAAFDIETRGFGGEIRGIGWRVEGDPDVNMSHDPEEWIDDLLSRKGRVIWYAHNAGGFDLLHLLPYLRAREGVSIQIIWQGRKGRCIGMVVKQGRRRLELRDSFAICPTSLKKMAVAFAPELPKGELDFEHVTWDWRNREHRDYLRRDVDALLTSVVTIWELSWKTFSCWPRWTLGSTAMRAWRQMLPEKTCIWQLNRPVEDWIRAGYYGGFVFLRHYGSKSNVVALDVNAMYPAVMRDHEFPLGSPFKVTAYDPRRLGIYKCVCYVPQSVGLPCLPLRHKDGVRWPTGHFATTVTTPEIEYARSLGCAVEVVEGYVWPERIAPFREMVDRCEALRKDAPSKSGLSEFVKYLQNSLYGKFGTRREAEDVLLTEDEELAMKHGYRPAIRPESGEIVDGVWIKGKEIDAPYIQPQWAAYVTAYARIKLHRLIRKVGISECWYGDTDSVWCDAEAADNAITKGLVELSKWHYGAVKRDGPYQRVEWRAAKVYCVWDEPTIDTPDGHFITAKGIPRKGRKTWYWHRPKSYVKWEGMIGMRNLITADADPALAVARRRRYSDLSASKGWAVKADGHTVEPVEANPVLDQELEQEAWCLRASARQKAEIRLALAHLRGDVLRCGGIAPTRTWPRESIPRAVRRLHGLPADYVASELGFDTADALLDSLRG